MAQAGRATAAGTARYAMRFLEGGSGAVPAPAREHYRQALGLTVSSVGGGTYLGDISEAVDLRYQSTLMEVVRCGSNVLDTAVNYRGQHSELALGRAVAALIESGEFSRDELVIASKGGFITHKTPRPADPVQYIYDNFVSTGIAEPSDFAGGIHCMTPDFLSQQISWSLRNTGLRTLDIYYLHNPETQLSFVDRQTFRNRLQLAFARLEEEVGAGSIGCYGVALWEGLRRPPMSAGYVSLEIMLRLASEVGGPDHHLKVIQLPVSVAMPDAATLRNQPVRDKLLTPLAACRDLGLTVMTSASIAQAQLAGRISGLLSDTFPHILKASQRALQFTRSLPGVTSALVGMSHPEHVRENLELATLLPEPERSLRLAHALSR